MLDVNIFAVNPVSESSTPRNCHLRFIRTKRFTNQLCNELISLFK